MNSYLSRSHEVKKQFNHGWTRMDTDGEGFDGNESTTPSSEPRAACRVVSPASVFIRVHPCPSVVKTIPTAWIRLRACLFVGVAVLLFGGVRSGFSHGVDLPKPTAAELAQTHPPLKGSVEFSSELIAHLRNRLNQSEADLLDHVIESFAAANRIRSGETHHASPADASYYHWRAEQNLLALLTQVPDLVTLDFRHGLPARTADGALKLDQQYNLLLLKVVTGNGPTNFVVHEMNMTTERDPKPYRITIASNATTRSESVV